MVLMFALYLPKLSSMASLISPKVTLLRAASMQISNRFPFPERADSFNVSRISTTFSAFRFAFICSSLSICFLRTSELSMSRISSSICFWADLKEFTPIMNSSPLSIFACFFAAASSILILGIPASIALVIPPSFSTSSMNFIASSIMSWVRLSTRWLPPIGSTTSQIPVSCCRIICVLRAILAE